MFITSGIFPTICLDTFFILLCISAPFLCQYNIKSPPPLLLPVHFPLSSLTSLFEDASSLDISSTSPSLKGERQSADKRIKLIKLPLLWFYGINTHTHIHTHLASVWVTTVFFEYALKKKARCLSACLEVVSITGNGLKPVDMNVMQI